MMAGTSAGHAFRPAQMLVACGKAISSAELNLASSGEFRMIR